MAVLLFVFKHDQRYSWRVYSRTLVEYTGNFRARLYDPQSELDSETLATLGTTTGENSTTTTGSHTGTEAMGLCALAGIRLICALHYYYLSTLVKEQPLDYSMALWLVKWGIGVFKTSALVCLGDEIELLVYGAFYSTCPRLEWGGVSLEGKIARACSLLDDFPLTSLNPSPPPSATFLNL